MSPPPMTMPVGLTSPSMSPHSQYQSSTARSIRRSSRTSYPLAHPQSPPQPGYPAHPHAQQYLSAVRERRPSTSSTSNSESDSHGVPLRVSAVDPDPSRRDGYGSTRNRSRMMSLPIPSGRQSRGGDGYGLSNPYAGGYVRSPAGPGARYDDRDEREKMREREKEKEREERERDRERRDRKDRETPLIPLPFRSPSTKRDRCKLPFLSPFLGNYSETHSLARPPPSQRQPLARPALAPRNVRFRETLMYSATPPPSMPPSPAHSIRAGHPGINSHPFPPPSLPRPSVGPVAGQPLHPLTRSPSQTQQSQPQSRSHQRSSSSTSLHPLTATAQIPTSCSAFTSTPSEPSRLV